MRRALRRGAPLVTIDARESNLARVADHWLRPRPATRRDAHPPLADGPPAQARAGRRTPATTPSSRRPPSCGEHGLRRSCSGRAASTAPAPTSSRRGSSSWRGAPASRSCRWPTAPTRAARSSSAPGRRAAGPPPGTGRPAPAVYLAALQAGRRPQFSTWSARCRSPNARPATTSSPRTCTAAVRGRRVPAGGVLRRGRGHADEHRGQGAGAARVEHLPRRTAVTARARTGRSSPGSRSGSAAPTSAPRMRPRCGGRSAPRWPASRATATGREGA